LPFLEKIGSWRVLPKDAPGNLEPKKIAAPFKCPYRIAGLRFSAIRWKLYPALDIRVLRHFSVEGKPVRRVVLNRSDLQ
jgi:hypothetical protein